MNGSMISVSEASLGSTYPYLLSLEEQMGLGTVGTETIDKKSCKSGAKHSINSARVKLTLY
jgi:hypothetical protein